MTEEKNKPVVLVVDDEVQIRRLLRLTLEAKTAARKDEMFEKLVGILGEPSEH